MEEDRIEGRVEFVGNLAEDKVRKKYNGKSILDFIGKKTYREFNYIIEK